MPKGVSLGAFEHLVLLALAGEAEATSGGRIANALVASTGGEVSIAAVYITLSRLEDKGMVRSRLGRLEGERRERKLFSLTAVGGEAVLEKRAHLDRLWERARRHPSLAGS